MGYTEKVASIIRHELTAQTPCVELWVQYRGSDIRIFGAVTDGGTALFSLRRWGDEIVSVSCVIPLCPTCWNEMDIADWPLPGLFYAAVVLLTAPSTDDRVPCVAQARREDVVAAMEVDLSAAIESAFERCPPSFGCARP